MPNESSSEQVISIRFVGDALEHSTLPIYEIAQVFIAVQRLFNKAYLANNERLGKNALPTRAERRSLALQVGVHERGSDYYGLIPFLSDPAVRQTFYSISKFVMSGLASYAMKDVLNRLQGTRGGDAKTQIYIGSIQGEVVNIVDRIDGLSGCDSIQIGCPSFNSGGTLRLDSNTRDYTHQIANEFYLGSVQTIRGVAYKLYPSISMIEIRRLPGRKKCKLFLNATDFDRIRYEQARSQVVTVTGRPRFKIGTELRSYNEFEVTKIDSIEGEDPSLAV